MSDSKRVFADILKVAHEAPLVVFDLDSTLFCVSHRTQKIMDTFAREPEVREMFPDEIARLPEVKVTMRDWGMKEAFIRAAFNASDAFAQAIKDYWNKHFFSNLFLHEDKPYPGAVEYVNALHEAGAQIWYLTGRNEKNMREGTVKSLKHWSFPCDDLDKRLIMKPHKGFLEDDVFKDLKIQELKKLSPKIWFFENEPLIINTVRRTSPEVTIVWLDTTHSRKATPPNDLFVIGAEWRHK